MDTRRLDEYYRKFPGGISQQPADRAGRGITIVQTLSPSSMRRREKDAAVEGQTAARISQGEET
jgi:hypothetical protein